ncbi:hypothetical protein [Lentzea guizhouensis]|uniref:hypothetical protein n=1 Tax=Lentzea guizhouensis TaxID=1586287 RepID=UPI0012B69335|nr:hypothetical protein [Lentzea guizhouensis]
MTNPWVPVITGGAAIFAALIALIGVHYGRWLQMHQERELRDDLWKREDRLRFNPENRVLYAEFLGEINRWLREIQQVTYFARDDQDTVRRWMYHRKNNDRMKLALIQDQVHLVSQKVWEASHDLMLKLGSVTVDAYNGHYPPQEAEWLSGGFHTRDLIRAMRDDLGIQHEDPPPAAAE